MSVDSQQLQQPTAIQPQGSEPEELQSEVLFNIRPARGSDFPIIQLMCEQAGMPFSEDFQFGTVAVNSDDQPVGFIRILEVTQDVNPQGMGAYVYPVVVFENWRHHGVARALVDYELQRYKALKLVACSPSRGFYHRAGFVTEAWDNIAAIIARDCELCADRSCCEPQPFRKVLTKESELS
ncbi:MAG: GNAT family N-acetyltransferase [Coriobacteriaceae bacterium]|nr:GNAT family N-acetyltransferase [Coriobacteriaceae bacterium]